MPQFVTSLWYGLRPACAKGDTIKKPKRPIKQMSWNTGMILIVDNLCTTGYMYILDVYLSFEYTYSGLS